MVEDIDDRRLIETALPRYLCRQGEDVMIRLGISAVALVAAAPALADEYLAVTPSGATEMMFVTKPEGTISALASKCMDAKMTVISSTSSELVCEAPLNFGQSLLGQLALGNSYSTPPRRFYRFNVATVQGYSRVQVSGWMELQMAFGQVRRTDFAGPEFHNSLMGFLGAAGGRPPIGTTYPNHAVIGFDVDPVPRGKTIGFRAKNVRPDMPGAKAGLLDGDVVFRIAGKTMKNDGEDYLDATAKAAKTPTYKVELERGGKIVVLTVERAFRPPVTAADYASFQPEKTAPVAVAVVAAPAAAGSVADELAKLAKLKADGVLTEAEFEAQKKKLLGL